MIEEELREFPYPEYKNIYEISNFGNVYRISDKKCMKIYKQYDDGLRIRVGNKYLK